MNKLEDWIIDCASGPFGSNLKVECFTHDGFPIIDGANLKEIALTDNITKFVSEQKARSLSKSIAKKHDVIVTISGTLGQISYIPETSKYEEYLCSQRQFRVTFDETKVNIKYLTYYFHTKEGQKKILSFANYVGVPALSQPLPNFKKITVSFPDINIQNKIAHFLTLLDDKIKLNNKINAELENMAKTLYDYWFVQFDFPDENKRPYKSANGKMIYNEVLKREIPEGWEVKNIFDVLDIQYGYPFNTELFTDNGGYSVVRIRDILTNSISAHTLEKADDKYKLHEGDLLIGMDGNFHMNYWNETGAYLNQRCVRIRCKEEQALSIIQAKYSLEPFIKKREQNISRTTVGHLSDKDFKSQYILAPKVNPNFHPKETFKSILCRITNNNNEIKNLVILRDFLLPLLINGQVSIQN